LTADDTTALTTVIVFAGTPGRGCQVFFVEMCSGWPNMTTNQSVAAVREFIMAANSQRLRFTVRLTAMNIENPALSFHWPSHNDYVPKESLDSCVS